MSPIFWNALLATEASPYKAGLVLQEVRESPFDPLASLRVSAHLSPAERARVDAVSSSALEKALREGARVVEADQYPEVMSEAGQVPLALFAHGDFSVLWQPCVAIVGTRSASAYGKAVAQKFAERLCAAGVTILSGGAFGIDGAAHEGALQSGGATAAVLATGVDVVYPSPHRGLFQRIRERGCLVSQFACGTKPERYRFLQRNELVAALSTAVLVIEAPEKSGALHTAGRANDLSRDVFVVPGNISNPNFRGSHALIRDGAILVDHPDQVLEHLGIEAAPIPEVDSANLSEVGRKLMAALSDEPMLPEALVQATGLRTDEILSELTMLELDGLVFRDGPRVMRRP